MIGWLHGQIVDRHQPGKLVLDVNGVGYDVETSLNTFFQIENDNQSVGLHIHTIVREDALLLYGFLDKEERSLFRALIKVNGVGPKLAMAILSSISPKEFIQCIHQENAALLTKLPGIGKKTAERLVIEMRDSIKQFDGSVSDTLQKQAGSAHSQEEAISALEALGYKPQEAWKVVNKIDNGNKSCEQLIREALQILSSR
ncbi:TPA: Holliday junction branch migration protein RuvA [Legionella pneumophila]|uniref:Holliday junction branch migration complex subunit RuvA n=1 Tax=Legionella pneumophila TaxID=446 RepID=A0A2S6EZ02_LEGPN|nr:Holliday junction branch migration protein RuvA [Legionella pneumophila]APF02947.1 Holliday junction DNA helicase RuvA [Legionella pneumophila subsp. fraseri]APF05977.1 Holliday junction DNA helicase RuvA [Legionella pneumophila subsp. fraseri]AUB68436.1 Holliday junction DNA helicase RuvA [Legionella pneumophila]AUB71409.1 Holliday junction DNA helicase RuvA [Legionella pneumophila]KXB24152.1 ATP-dependent DNA helicase RuvA [Legionella pneumophila]